MTDLHFTRDDSYSRLCDAIVAISNASRAMRDADVGGLTYIEDNYLENHEDLDYATQNAWNILRDEVAVDPVRDEVREAVDGQYTEEDRVAILREILDDYDARHDTSDDGDGVDASKAAEQRQCLADFRRDMKREEVTRG